MTEKYNPEQLQVYEYVKNWHSSFLQAGLVGHGIFLK
jgi:hypothetical protein